MPLPRVIMAEPTTRFDLSGAERHGQIEYLSRIQLNPFTTEGMIGIFKHRLQEIGFNPESDMICLTGQTLTVSILTAVAATLFPSFKLLMFHAGTSDYRVRLFTQEQNHGSPASRA